MLRVFKTPRVHVSDCVKKTEIFLLLGFAIPWVRTECPNTRQKSYVPLPNTMVPCAVMTDSLLRDKAAMVSFFFFFSPPTYVGFFVVSLGFCACTVWEPLRT